MATQDSCSPPPVLIVGAGPTGLLTSLWLTNHAVPHRIIDKVSTTGQTSRAVVVHARTLEMYRILDPGLADEIVQTGAKIEQLDINNSGKKKGEILVGDAGVGQSKYPFILTVTQDEHEAILQQRLEEAGTKVERGVEMVKMDLPAADDTEGYPEVTLHQIGTATVETMTASYVIGCDGAHSGVRHATGISMEGGTYQRTFFVADVFCRGQMQMDANLNICLSSNEFIVILPLPHKSNRARIIGIVPTELQGTAKIITFDDCRPSVEKAAPGLTVDEVRWFAHYKVHHRCAGSFQYGHRVFLCGDAAHLHSPVGGQGMNTGLGDASNLAWKVATAWHASAKSSGRTETLVWVERLLSTYTIERKRFADRLVHSNDRMFQFIIQQNALGWLLRSVIAPYVLPFLAGFFNLRAFWYKTVSQIGIEYSTSVLSHSNSRRTLQGYRLPWIERPNGAAGEEDNHSLLDGSGWQAHNFGVILSPVQQILQQFKVPLLQFPWSSEAQRKGLTENTLYLIRPDGYIGLVLENKNDSETILFNYIQGYGVGKLR